MNYIIREAEESDAQAIHDIYGAYVDGVHVTFTDVNPDVEAYRQKIIHVKEKYPFYVAEAEDGQILGYVCGAQLRPHDSYRWNVESTIMLHPQAPRRQGIASAIYQKFMDTLSEWNYQYVYGVIVDTNEASIELHRSLGFQEVGHFTQAGYKHGQWLGIVWMSKFIGKPGEAVQEPVCKR